ncbi:hypothetical protein GOBAR_AA03053 [Gossypium barbadense]|uniref:Uncharacterized protein n=1 Tax=Gossypium barbadense TaxID=3634 RepID=A0A2P5YPM9_GOSBA|nr:hypothetical protein GOBAR_AA03053 [Gossypium barbadense]
MEEKSVSTEDSSNTNLVRRKNGKEPVVPTGDVVVCSTPTTPMTSMAPICSSHLVGPNFGTIRNVSRASPLGSLPLTSPDGEMMIAERELIG